MIIVDDEEEEVEVELEEDIEAVEDNDDAPLFNVNSDHSDK
jgi:hypothetical protein